MPALRSYRPTALLLVVLLALGMSLVANGRSTASAAAGPQVKVEGNRLVDASGATVQLAGVNKSGSEYACTGGWGFFDGPVDSAAVALMASWNINAVRVPLNEHCWLGRNGADPAYSGPRYRAAIRGFVQRLQDAGLVAVLELHWSRAGDQLAVGQALMPNTDHSVAFWDSVAREFRDNPGVMFELYNEPHDVSWQCWRDGCDMPGGWRAAGMQQLLDTVRATGATQPVIATGLDWGGDLSGWLAHHPHDPAGQLVAGWHQYDFGGCMAVSCWESNVLPVARQVPVVATEVGQTDCGSDYIVSMLRWLDSHGISHLTWTWNDWDGCGGPALLTDYDGTPSRYGSGVRDYLRSRNSASLAISSGSHVLRRLGGPGRVETAVAVSAATFEPGVEVAFVARQDVHADALAAGPVAAASGGPVLLVSRYSIPSATRSELERLRPRRIVALGGGAALDETVMTQLQGLAAGGITRVGGANRYETAVRLSREYSRQRPDVAFVASGETFADALAGGAAAAAAGAPMLLVPTDDAPEAVLGELTRLDPARVVLLGGDAAVSERVAGQLSGRLGVPIERLAGADRYETAARVAATFGDRRGTVFVSTGTQFPDALAGVPAAAAAGAPIVLVRPTGGVPEAVHTGLARLDPATVVVLGGEQAVSHGVARGLLSLLAAP